MDWPDIDDVKRAVSAAESWLRDVEPAVIADAPIVLRLPVYYIIVIIAVAFVVDTARGLVGGAYRLVCSILHWLAHWLLRDLADDIARGYVRVEAVALRLRIVSISATRVKLDDDPPPRIETPIVLARSPLPLGTGLNYLRLAAGVPIKVFAAGIILVAAMLRALLRPRLRNVVAAVAALWYAALLVPIIGWAGQVRLGDIQLTVFVAAGTLSAVIYAAANSDVRGRAELNKTASLACRAALHGCTHSLLTIANRLAAIREAAYDRLRLFPTRVELAQLTGRDDFAWQERSLLPQQARILPHRLRKVAVLNDLVGGKTVRDYQYLVLEPPPGDHSLLNITDAKPAFDELTAASERIRASLVTLRETGYLGKLDRVLDAPARALLVLLSRVNFGVDTAELIVQPDGSTLLDAIVDSDEERERLVSQWEFLANAEPDDEALREACRDLGQLLRRTIREQHDNQWWAAVVEHRVRYLAETIDKSLRPRLIERLRQAFGK